MAYICDNTHPEPTPAFVVMTAPETGDTNALCPFCLMEWAYGILVQSEPGLELIKGKMLEIAAEAKAEESKTRRGGRKAAGPAAEAGEDTGAIAAATDTPVPM